MPEEHWPCATCEGMTEAPRDHLRKICKLALEVRTSHADQITEQQVKDLLERALRCATACGHGTLKDYKKHCAGTLAAQAAAAEAHKLSTDNDPTTKPDWDAVISSLGHGH